MRPAGRYRSGPPLALAPARALLLLAAACSAAAAADLDSRGRRSLQAVGGSAAEEKRFPYIVSLRTGPSAATPGYGVAIGEHFCGGVLVGESAVLTAASCVIDAATRKPRPDPWYFASAYVGAYELKGDSQRVYEKRQVVGVTVHPVFVTGDADDALNFDLALLQLNRSVNRRRVAIAPTKTKPALPAPELSRLVSLGWGATSKGGATPSETLQQVATELLPLETCQARIPAYPGAQAKDDLFYYNFATNGLLCHTGSACGLCGADKGGPTLLLGADSFRDVLVGITSTPRCGDGPDLMANVAAVRPWLAVQLRKLQGKGAKLRELTCQQSNPRCTACNAKGECTACNGSNKLFLDAGTKQCTMCAELTPNCKRCGADGTCRECAGPAFVLDRESKTCASSAALASATKCARLGKGAACAACVKGYRLDGGTGKCRKLTCAERAPGCKACDAAGRCTACEGTRFAVDKATGECRKRRCSAVDPQCRTCDATRAACLACRNPDSWTVDSKTQLCRRRTCADAHPDGSCSACNARLECLACTDSSYRLDGGSKKCVKKACSFYDPLCATCSFSDEAPFTCTACVAGAEKEPCSNTCREVVETSVVERTNAELTCPDGQVITKIVEATYANTTVAGCSLDGSRNVSECVGSAFCFFNVTNDYMGGDPCFGAWKTLTLKYTCGGCEVQRIEAQQDSKAELACPDKQAISTIPWARYGGSSFVGNPACAATDPFKPLGDCVGNNKCSFTANNAAFGGDPCPTFEKRFWAKYFCA
ncbi:transmembrane protease serine 12 [Micractinium conductrix]|uniref:Transmembrane protease serine 12 n=1 Tax=Micractinium conductrix TaxID=554055 RepID=A0A2P6V1X6_9CHLO|nr:transmembrane protease serine 12 [Micractinium conductrix]|eukprot:PSC68093.1 transmembrane protease serine 12 [Micractinium conductrix]